MPFEDFLLMKFGGAGNKGSTVNLSVLSSISVKSFVILLQLVSKLGFELTSIRYGLKSESNMKS